MSVALCMTAFDRADLLKVALENLLVTYPCGADVLSIVVDGGGSTRSEIEDVIKIYANMFPGAVVVSFLDRNVGIAGATQLSFTSPLHDVLIHIDSDFYIKQAGWAKKLGEFLVSHPEVGIAAPDLPGRYMRIHRPDYDEVEYAMGAVMAVRREVFHHVSAYLGEGFFDKNLHHQWDPDTCYRARMLGYRVGIVPLGECVHLGEGTGDSSRPSVWKGGFEFLRKWNLYFIGQYRYKSPYCLRWDEMPLNYLWRREWLAQFSYNERPRVETIQGHKFEMIEMPITPSKWLLPQTRDGLRINARYSGVDSFEKVDAELLSGQRGWNVGDLKRQENGGNDGR